MTGRYFIDASIPMRDADGTVLGAPDARTGSAMQLGKLMTAERLQAVNEAARRGGRGR